MSRRIEIELTSARADGSWTWRVAGAKQPKGVLDGGLLPGGAKVGDVLRADAEIELEGTVITAVLPQPQKHREPDRLTLLDNKPFEPITTTLATKGPRGRDRDDRGPRQGGRAGPRSDAPGAAGRQGRQHADRGIETPLDRSDRPERAERPERGARPSGPRSDRPGGPGSARPSGPRSDRPATPRSDRPSSSRPDRPGPERADRSAPTRGGRPERAVASARPQGQSETSSGPGRAKRLNPGSVYRNAVLESLSPEERAVAEQVLHGGVPAVRRALQEQNAKAVEGGGTAIKADALVALAEELLPRLKSAEWRDRAEAAAKEADGLNLRDLRSVVAGADAGARDDDSRILAKTLREALERRENAERETWMGEVTTCLDEGRVARALRLAGRPPDARTRIPAELTTRLTDAASAAMAPDTPIDRWAQLLAALLESPVRRAVKPIGLPAQPGDALLTAARQASGRVPALAALLGLTIPPPPGPHRPGMRPRPPVPPPRRAQTPTVPVVDSPVVDSPVVDSPLVDSPLVDSPVVSEVPMPAPSVDDPPTQSPATESDVSAPMTPGSGLDSSR